MVESPAANPRILLLDSDRARATRRCEQLASQGWHLINAATVSDAVRKAGSECIDLALLAVSAGEAAQTELPGRIQQQAGDCYLPVIVIDAQDSTEQQRCCCLDSGADDILPDSIGSGELWARMKSLLRIKGLQDALHDSRRALQEALRREHELLVKVRADNDRLSQQVITDPLTRLYNVRYFQKFLDDEFKIARRYGHSLGLLVLDLDHFKMVNDRHGHLAGDFVLKEFSVLLRTNVRDSDVVARTGGEEFAVILPRADRVQTGLFAHRIRRKVAEHHFPIGPTGIRITCSIGQACFGPGTDVAGPRHLMYFADQALLAAKRSGRNRVIRWAEMNQDDRARLRSQIQDVADAEEWSDPRCPAFELECPSEL